MPARRCLPVILIGVLVGSCGAPPPGPTETSVQTAGSPSTEAATPTPSVTPQPAATPALAERAPRIVIRSPTASGGAWFVTEPGQPQRRSALEVPFPDLELGPAAEDGRILATTTEAGLLMSIDDTRLVATASLPVPPGESLLPACFAGDGRPIYADGETLMLVELAEAGTRPVTDVPFTLGECAPLADGGTLVALDGGALVAQGGDGSSTAIVGARGRHLSGGGGLIAMTDPLSESGEAIVRSGTVSAEGTLGEAIGGVAGQGSERVVNAQLSPDGGWLVVLLERETEAEPEGRLRLYRVAAEGLQLVSDLSIDVGSRIVVLPGS